MNELIALDLPGGLRFVEELQRAWENGDAVVPIDQRLPSSAKTALVRTLAPSRIISETEVLDLPNSVPVIPGDALVVATSGTTGMPKGVVLTHVAVAASANATNARLGVDPGADRWFATLPVAHIGGLSVITRALASGTPVTVVPHFDPTAVDDAARSGYTRTSLVVTALGRVRPEGWRTILLGGSAMPPDLPGNCVRTYGMTETGSGVVYNGEPLDGVEVTIDASGEISLRGPMLLRAYRGADGDGPLTPEGRDPKSVDGSFRTGDVGHFEAGGALVVLGRRGDVIVTGAEKVWPDVVERALIGLPGVREYAVAGQPDPVWGHRVTLFVATMPGAKVPTLDTIRATVSSELASYAAPRALVVVEALPRTTSGKVDRRALASLPTPAFESR